MTSWVRMMAVWAFFFGMRVHSRRYFTPGNVWVRPTLMDASPRVPPMYGLPRPVAFLPLRLPADSVVRGVCLAREDAHVNADLGDEVLAGGDPEAGDVIELRDLLLVWLAHFRDLLVQDRDLAGELVDAVQHHLQDEGVFGGEERAVQGLFELAGLAAHHAPCLVREHLRAALAGDDRSEHVAAGYPVDVADHRGQLEVRVLQQLLAAFLLCGAHLDQLAPVTGVSA